MLNYTVFTSKFGTALAVYEDDTIVYISLGSDNLKLIQEMKSDFNAIDEPINANVDQKTVEGLKHYLDNQDAPQPKYSYHLFGTKFQRDVWDRLIQSKRGETFTYSGLAEKLGLSASSSRAVANAVGANRISILIPCHRVLRKDGDLGGYRWGPTIKKKLLVEEAQSLNAV
ncbi:BA75_02141T0 [Komagataella pastoris]|uniref:Methylated-DNA--protein-cysteine methyltransferase n=1 Tax=Komagataella pastoris TaxID=4922 RepID=A0A1B2JC30_PICPA|nr:BA75_02141T0 [Komagataella pastoris]